MVHRVLRRAIFTISVLLPAAMTGCMVGPPYHPPKPLAEDLPDAYKESPLKDPSHWMVAKPQDAMLRGKWWEIFHDAQLNDLEGQLDINNQNIKQYFQNYLAARALVAQARSQLYPTVSVGPSYTRSRYPAGINGNTGNGTGSSEKSTGSSEGAASNSYQLPLDVSWEPDLWGRVRNTINQAVYNSQLSAADLENERLTEHMSLAVYWFEIRGQDALQKIYDDTVAADKKLLEYTKAQFETGIGDQISVIEAENTLDSAETTAAGIGIVRAQYEHAIAVLVGKSPSQFRIKVDPQVATPPAIPVGVPSQLLQRRPDVAAAERAMAAANAQIGIADAAFYPSITLNASAGFESSLLKTLLNWPSRFWSIGATASYTVFDAGLRQATVDQYVATYNANLATYRQTVLTAFQQVEDNLVSVRLLAQQADKAKQAVQSGEQYVKLEQGRYETGVDPYSLYVQAQTTLLGDQQVELTVRVQELTSAVQLIAALGGGWDSGDLPTTQQVSERPTTQERTLQQ